MVRVCATVSARGAAEIPVLFPMIVFAGRFASFPRVTTAVPMVAVIAPVPVPVTSPDRVIVWSPEFVPVRPSMVLAVAMERTS